jgi:CrcB protein
MMKILYIIAGGAIGALSRYAITGLSHRWYNGLFPLGTLAVNLIGSFIIGFLWATLENTNISANVRTFLFIGILGSFTTFSSYTLETLHFMREGEMKTAFLNLLYHNFFGLILVFGGFIAAKATINAIR